MFYITVKKNPHHLLTYMNERDDTDHRSSQQSWYMPATTGGSVHILSWTSDQLEYINLNKPP
jgi:hypothetical protein